MLEREVYRRGRDVAVGRQSSSQPGTPTVAAHENGTSDTNRAANFGEVGSLHSSESPGPRTRSPRTAQLSALYPSRFCCFKKRNQQSKTGENAFR
ncbi:Hypothetical protein NTJ_01277 [Nesidiocoris tenuis]|uniref:Uncharacterized protein n=1 Tax=Nesidiocoris tenuis TaxID=355587 RepID=A0ABN7ACB8_9HEMI|nr:Hypothetical protein NTJ_01277 [Nesidiocoris tenuis]